jgi:transcriptional regulator with XRE-family HTH domain
MILADCEPKTVDVSNPKWFAQPVMVYTMTKRKPARDILAANIERLREATGRGKRLPQSFLAKAGGPSQSTVGRWLNQRTAPTLRTIDAAAAYFGLEPWQLLIEDLDIENKPRLEPQNESEFHRRVAELAKELGIERRMRH